jgi:DNA mismatch repair protein MutS2
MFLVELNNQLAEHKKAEREEERKVLKYLTDLVRSQRSGVEGVYEFCVTLDVLQAKAAFAAKLDAAPIPVGDTDAVDLRRARHPLLVLAKGPCKPLDIHLREGEKALVVTGGNAGGKTVCLKTLGLVSAMALAALPVPVEAGSRLPLWSGLFVFMGDEQSIEESLSTFTAQINQISRAYEQIGPQALVVLDEFGAGTDPTQGAALAQAVIDGLMDKGARVVAATHFPALKTYALSREGVRAASMVFDPATKKPLFELAYDQVGASIALDVAREHGLPAEILAKAEEYLLMEGGESGDVLDRLNALAVERQREIERLEADRAKMARRREKLEVDYAEQKAKLIDDVRAESRRIVQRWQEDKLGRKEAQRKLAEARKKLEPAAEEQPAKTVDFETLSAGDRVRYVPWGKTGAVAEINPRKKQVKVDISGVSMWVDVGDLEPLDAKGGQPKPKAAPQKASVTAERSPAMQIDLRGQRADVAVTEVEKFLDRAILAGREDVEIVHGRGTGALRREVHGFLREFPAVKSFRLAPEDEGGDGKTIVELA